MLVTVALIFLFLVWVVAPLFAPVSVERTGSLDTGAADPVAVAAGDSFAVASLITRSGKLIFMDVHAAGAGRSPELERFTLTDGGIRAARPLYPSESAFAILVMDNRLLFHRIVHQRRFTRSPRPVESRVHALFAGSAIDLESHAGNGVVGWDVFRDAGNLRVAILENGGGTILLEYPDADETRALAPPTRHRLAPAPGAANVVIGPGGRLLYLFTSDGSYRLVDIARPDNPIEQGTGRLTGNENRLTALEMLLGRYSVLAAEDSGRVTQWSLVREGTTLQLAPVRQFRFESPIVGMRAEPGRKGFVAFARDNRAHLVHTTSHRVLHSFEVEPGPMTPVAAFSPAGDRLFLADGRRLSTWSVRNLHPEISWSTLWRRIWYEGYAGPVHNWQSSSADTDFEPKFSLTPLLFGTLKAAFYAMLFAVPLAVMGAVYTACFMSPAMRRWVRPGMEMMAGMPTVVLGFLAGLWLAPLVDDRLGAVLVSLAALPLSVLAFALAWHWLPGGLKARSEGWLALMTAPVLAIAGYLVFSFDAELEALLFGGDARSWLQGTFGFGFNQRNALVVGAAMGLAVVPVIFSISEQAVGGVPAHLVQGSLALGATRWQTVSRIVLLTASPGIFSAILIGLGRAVGETMIVLMASGNTPILDLNVFQGMRTFAANIAVELPGAEPGSSHYRILFLIALLLFVITFAFNTVAEVVRERLRNRYAGL